MCEFKLLVQETLNKAINSEIGDDEILAVERSLYSHQYIFTKITFDDGNLTYKEYS
jgi:hypothetical protein